MLQDGNRSGVAELVEDTFNVILCYTGWLGTQDLLGRREYVFELLLIFPCETLFKVSDLKSGLEFGSALHELENLLKELLG